MRRSGSAAWPGVASSWTMVRSFSGVVRHEPPGLCGHQLAPGSVSLHLCSSETLPHLCLLYQQGSVQAAQAPASGMAARSWRLPAPLVVLLDVYCSA